MTKITKAIIPAAGFGTRLLPTTIAVPKEMLPIVDKPTIQYVVEEAVNSGIKEIIIITADGKEAIQKHFTLPRKLVNQLEKKAEKKLAKEVKAISKLAKIKYITQKKQLGLGHAVLQAKDQIGNQPFVVLLGDAILESKTNAPCTKQLVQIFNRYQQSVVAVERKKKAEVSSYGVIDPIKKVANRVYQVKDMIEKPEPAKAPSALAVCARYLFQPEIFELLEKTKPGKGGEIQLTDAMRSLPKKSGLMAKEIDGVRHDIGKKKDFVLANLHFGIKDPEIKKKAKKILRKRSQPAR